MAFYLKYRPQTLEQLIGQPLIKHTLQEAFLRDKLSHAYLFSGPRGTGKTSTARILAKMVNCENNVDARGPAGSVSRRASSVASLPAASRRDPSSPSPLASSIPCNNCTTCLSITDGSNLDLIEIDAASNRGIDDIRALRENIKLAPSGAKKKVYIIDEVHMLTQEAFNALLKTLEEPPAHTIFILATTEDSKVPKTILSRVMRLDFKLASQSDVLEALKKVVDGEKIKIGEEALKAVAKKADGSFRDGVKLLDQLSSTNKEIKIKNVEEILSTGSFDEVLNFLEKLADKNSKEALMFIVKKIKVGLQIKIFTLLLLDILRSLVFIKNDLGIQLVKEDLGTDKYQTLKELVGPPAGRAGKFSTKDLVKTINILQEALEKMKTASIQSLPLELAVVEICENQTSDIRQKTSENKNVIASTSTGSTMSTLSEAEGLTTSTLSINEAPPPAGRAGKQSQKQITASPSAPPTSHPSATLGTGIPHPTSNSDISKLNDKWTFVLETVRQYNFSLEALLRSSKVADCKEGIVLLEVPYTFHQRILEQPKSKDLLEAVLSEVMAYPVKVSTILGQRPQKVEDIANVEIAPEDEIITLASEIFNGKLVD